MNAVPAELDTSSERTNGAPGLEELERHRRELTRHCVRMLGSFPEADDAVQETMLRAWRSSDRFEGRSTVRTWLYRIATNVCLDLRRAPHRRATVMDLGPASTAESLTGGRRRQARLRSIGDARGDHPDDDLSDLIARRESIRLAFLAAVQHLPPRQRAVTILCDVLRWRAREVAALLDVSVASVTSAQQRARVTLATRDVRAPIVLDEEQQRLLDGYVDAFARYDAARLVSLLREEARRSPVLAAAVDVSRRPASSPPAGGPPSPAAGR